MFNHILVPVGRVGEVRNALEYAAQLCEATPDCRITLLHVVELIQDTSRDDFEDFYASLERQANEELNEAAQRYRQLGVDMAYRVTLGRRVRAILDFVDEQGVDLIVLQSHPIDLSDPGRGWATISYQVAILARCPVMLVK